MGQESAIEWYNQELNKITIQLENKEITIGAFAVKKFELYVQAKEIEKNNIINSYCDGRLSVVNKEIISAEDYYDKKFNFLSFLTVDGKVHKTQISDLYKFQYIYISSDEKLKEGDWCYSFISNKIGKIDKDYNNGAISVKFENDYFESSAIKKFKKIILTTDPKLISDGVQAIKSE